MSRDKGGIIMDREERAKRIILGLQLLGNEVRDAGDGMISIATFCEDYCGMDREQSKQVSTELLRRKDEGNNSR